VDGLRAVGLTVSSFVNIKGKKGKKADAPRTWREEGGAEQASGAVGLKEETQRESNDGDKDRERDKGKEDVFTSNTKTQNERMKE